MMSLFYLVLVALAVVADLRDAIWFVPLALSVGCAILWFIAHLAAAPLVDSQGFKPEVTGPERQLALDVGRAQDDVVEPADP